MNTLTLTTNVDLHGDRSYSLEGMLKDEDGRPFPVGEFSFKRERIERSVKYYVEEFNVQQVVHLTVQEAI